MLQKLDFPGDRYATLLVKIEIAANAPVPRHTHPGLEAGYVSAGEVDLMVDGQPVQHLKASDSYQIAAGVPHAAKGGATAAELIATYVIEKDKPLASPAP